MNRGPKQFVYGSIFLTLAISLIFGGYFLLVRPAPSCFDKRQNQGEEGVDCGGVCEQFCYPAVVKPITKTGDAKIFSIDERRSNVLVEVQNANTSLAAKRFEYTLRFYGEDGIQIDTVSGESFIYAEEVKYVLYPSVSIPRRNINRVDFEVTNVEWASSEAFKKPNVSIQDQAVRVVGREIRVTGTVVNQDLRTLPNVEIVALFYGTFRQIAGASRAEVEEVGVDERRQFTVIYPESSIIVPENAKVFVHAYRP